MTITNNPPAWLAEADAAVLSAKSIASMDELRAMYLASSPDHGQVLAEHARAVAQEVAHARPQTARADRPVPPWAWGAETWRDGSVRRQWTPRKLDTLSVLDRLDGDREQDVSVHVVGTETRGKPDQLHVMV